MASQNPISVLEIPLENHFLPEMPRTTRVAIPPVRQRMGQKVKKQSPGVPAGPQKKESNESQGDSASQNLFVFATLETHF